MYIIWLRILKRVFYMFNTYLIYLRTLKSVFYMALMAHFSHNPNLRAALVMGKIESYHY